MNENYYTEVSLYNGKGFLEVIHQRVSCEARYTNIDAEPCKTQFY